MIGKKKSANRISTEKSKMPNYNVYHFSASEKILYTLIFSAAGAVTGFVLYGNLFMKDGEMTLWTYISNVVVCVIGGIVATAIFFPVREKQIIDGRKESLRVQFREMLSALSTAYMSGDNTYNAFNSAYKEMKAQFGSNSYITEELNEIVEGMKNNFSVSTMLIDFGERSGVADIIDFSNMFQMVADPGGDLKYIVKNTYDMIGEKMAINEEIQTKITSNKMQLNIMSVVPVFMIAFLRFTSSSFAASFASLKGVIAMTVAVILFIGSYIYGRKIIDIKG